MLSRSTILLAAHAATRARRAPLRIPFPGFVLDRQAGAFVCTIAYRVIFAEELRKAWAEAKARARLEAIKQVEIVLSDADRAEVDRLDSSPTGSPSRSSATSGARRCGCRRRVSAMRRRGQRRQPNPTWVSKKPASFHVAPG